MSHETITRVLSRVEVFDGLSTTELETLLEGSELVDFAAGETLLVQGEEAHALHIVIEGLVEVVLPQEITGKPEHRPSEVFLNALGEGECFGEYSLVDKKPASASIVALEAGRLIRVPEDRFSGTMAANDHIAGVVYGNMLRLLIERLREREREYDLVLVV